MNEFMKLTDALWNSFGQDFIVGIAILGVSGFVWLITSQMIFNAKTSRSIIETNNNLSGAITAAAAEFKIAMATLKQQSDDQKIVCEYHRKQTEDLSRRINEVRNLVDQLFENAQK